MARYIKIVPNKTYATEGNCIKAVEKLFPEAANDGLRYFIYYDTDSSRYFPVFVGAKCLEFGVQFHFNVIG